MPVPSAITDLSQTAGSNSPAGSESPALLDDYTRTVFAFIAKLRDGQGLSNPVDLASAATTDIGAQTSPIVRITGTTTITSFGANYAGPRFLTFAGALTLTHNATSLILPGGANITTAAGDCAIAVPNGSTPNGWRVVSYQLAAGGFSGTVPIAQGGTGQTTASAAFNALKQAATDAASGVVELATATEFNTGTDTARVPPVSVIRANQIVESTSVSLNGLTSTDFTSPGSWVKEFSIHFAGLSTNGTAGFLVQLMDSGGAENTGYAGVLTLLQNAAAVQAGEVTTGAGATTTAAANVYRGHITFRHVTGDTWEYDGMISAAAGLFLINGSKTLSASLTGARLLCGGSDTFDAGTATAHWS